MKPGLISKFPPCASCPATSLNIRVKQPETEHTVSVGKLQSRFNGGGKSPNEHVLKSRLRDLL